MKSSVAKVVVLSLAILGSPLACAEGYISIAQDAHRVGFRGCENFIAHTVHDFEASSNGRYVTDYMHATVHDSFNVIATWGKPGDTVFVSDSFTKKGARCYVDEVSQITLAKSCMQYASENPVWKYQAATGDVTYMQNAGGVNALLKSFNHGCIVTFQLTKEGPAQ